jgi:hypothetical protein
LQPSGKLHSIAAESKYNNEIDSNAGGEEFPADWHDSACYYHAPVPKLYEDNTKRCLPKVQLAKLQTEAAKLLKNSLVFDRSHDMPGTTGCYKYTFLCSDIKDKDLPWKNLRWNTTETD